MDMTRRNFVKAGTAVAAASALAALVSDEELCEDFIMPEPFDPRAVEAVAAAVRNCVAD